MKHVTVTYVQRKAVGCLGYAVSVCAVLYFTCYVFVLIKLELISMLFYILTLRGCLMRSQNQPRGICIANQINCLSVMNMIIMHAMQRKAYIGITSDSWTTHNYGCLIGECVSWTGEDVCLSEYSCTVSE